MKTLIVVDVQKDFYSPQGSLYVKGGEEVVPRIKELIEKDQEINQVIFTVDWHSLEDCSFKKNGGIWPNHCVQYSEGASIPDELFDAVVSRGFQNLDNVFFFGKEQSLVGRSILSNTYDIFKKGEIPGEEEYGAFGGNSEICDDDPEVISLASASEDSYSYINLQSDIIVCGIAGDYCVLETAKNLKKCLKGSKLYMFMDGIRSIDDGTKLKEWMNQEGVEVYEL